MATYRITGFNGLGEANIVDDDGRLVACADLVLDTYLPPEKGDEYTVSVSITWDREQESDNE